MTELHSKKRIRFNKNKSTSMKVITIPKTLVQKDDLVILPRREYEKLLDYRFKHIQEVELSGAQKQRLQRARQNFSKRSNAE